MDFKKSQTLKNLTRAFASECQDGAKYQYLADMATQKKQSQVSQVLKDLATNEMAHAKVFYDYIDTKCPGGIPEVNIEASYPMDHGELVEMLKIKGDNEDLQAKKIYPIFAKTARDEGFSDIAEKLERIAKIEQNHADILHTLHEKLKNNTLYSSNSETLFKCTNCGHEEKVKKGWKTCPICEFNQGFIKLNFDIDCNCTAGKPAKKIVSKKK